MGLPAPQSFDRRSPLRRFDLDVFDSLIQLLLDPTASRRTPYNSSGAHDSKFCWTHRSIAAHENPIETPRILRENFFFQQSSLGALDVSCIGTSLTLGFTFSALDSTRSSETSNRKSGDAFEAATTLEVLLVDVPVDSLLFRRRARPPRLTQLLLPQRLAGCNLVYHKLVACVPAEEDEGGAVTLPRSLRVH